MPNSRPRRFRPPPPAYCAGFLWPSGAHPSMRPRHARPSLALAASAARAPARAVGGQAASPRRASDASPRRLLGTPTGRAHAAPRRSRSAPGRAHGARRASSRRSRRCRPRPRASALLGASTGGARGQSRARRRSAAPRSAVAPPLPQPSRIAARVPASLAHGHGHGPRSRRRSGSSTARAPSARGAPPPRRGTPKGRARSATGPLAQLRARTRRRGRLAACPASRAHAPTASVGPSVAPRGGVSSTARRPPVGARRASRGERRGELKNVSSRFLKRRLPFAARTNRGQRHTSHGVPRGPRRRGSRSLGARGGGVPPPPAPRRSAKFA